VVVIAKHPRRDAAIVAAATLVLWFILDGDHSVASVIAGIAVATALGVWVPVAEL
jgi:hypothetical protein